jgi:hypothetical protein
MLLVEPRLSLEITGRETWKERYESMEEGTMGKVTEMRVHTFAQEENSQGIKEEVDPADKANNSQSVGKTKDKW